MGRRWHGEPVDWRTTLRRFLGAGESTPGRTTGRPPSGNGASSFHLTWDVPPVPLAEVSVTFEVLEPPIVDKLYFWALQVSFLDGQRRTGGAHFGLQHNPAYPEACGVNWGGYHEGAGELDGSVSDLPSAPDNINTRDYLWSPNRRYRHRIFRSPERGWRGSITDLDTGQVTVVRDLWVTGDRLAQPMVWSEVFADCDDPSVLVRWTDLEVITTTGEVHRPHVVHLNYQTHNNGGCANTNTSTDGVGFLQRTTTERLNGTGTRLSLPR
ncbi:MAG: hypothetical protein AAGA65_24690 [Actinomycetota bacterium]